MTAEERVGQMKDAVGEAIVAMREPHAKAKALIVQLRGYLYSIAGAPPPEFISVPEDEWRR